MGSNNTQRKENISMLVVTEGKEGEANTDIDNL